MPTWLFPVLAFAGSFIGTLGAGFALAWRLGGDWRRVKDGVADHEVRLRDVEPRVTRIEARLDAE